MVEVVGEFGKVTTILPEKKDSKFRTAAYCRVSTDLELQELSFETQRDYYEKKIKSDPQMELVGIYGDKGKTGTDTKSRPEFRRLMRDCRAGKIDLILCKSVSRFGRNMADLTEELRELGRLGVNVKFEKEGLDTSQENTGLLLGILATVAQEESNSISVNMRVSHRTRLEKGKPYGAVAYGYRQFGKDHEWSEHEPEAKRVRLAFNMALDGYKYPDIRRALQQMEDDEATGKKWSQSILYYLLTNSNYTGDYLSNKTIVIFDEYKGKTRIANNGEETQYCIEEHHTELVSRTDFDFVQKLIGRHLLSANKKKWTAGDRALIRELEERRRERGGDNKSEKIRRYYRD